MPVFTTLKQWSITSCLHSSLQLQESNGDESNLWNTLYRLVFFNICRARLTERITVDCRVSVDRLVLCNIRSARLTDNSKVDRSLSVVMVGPAINVVIFHWECFLFFLLCSLGWTRTRSRPCKRISRSSPPAPRRFSGFVRMRIRQTMTGFTHDDRHPFVATGRGWKVQKVGDERIRILIYERFVMLFISSRSPALVRSFFQRTWHEISLNNVLLNDSTRGARDVRILYLKQIKY